MSTKKHGGLTLHGTRKLNPSAAGATPSIAAVFLPPRGGLYADDGSPVSACDLAGLNFPSPYDDEYLQKIEDWTAEEVIEPDFDVTSKRKTLYVDKTDVPRSPKQRRNTDVGNAERFAEQHGTDVRYCHQWDKWLVWDGRRWVEDYSGEVERRAKRTARSIYEEATKADDRSDREDLSKWATKSEQRERINAILALAKSEQPIPIDVDSLDAEPWLLNCENGTVDLRTGELREPERADYITKLCPVEYSTEAGDDPVLWLEFLNEIFADNDELIRFVQQLMGLALVGKVEEHILPIFYGTGANGKSVFLETVCGILGPEYAMAAPNGFLMASKSDRHPTEVADLHGMRLVAATETDDGCRLSEALVKQLTGGDRLRARRMRENFWGFTPSHTAILTTNHKPVIRGADNGIWRRIKLVPFNVTIPEGQRDTRLKEKLEREWPAILRWMVSGCIDWQRSGLQTPQEVVAATDGYRSDMDILGKFLEDCCEFGDGLRVGATEIYRAYSRWAEIRGEFVEGQTKFGCRLTERFDKVPDSRNCKVYIGLKLRPADDLDDEQPF